MEGNITDTGSEENDEEGYFFPVILGSDSNMGCLCFQIKLTDQPFDYWPEPAWKKWFRLIKIKLRSSKNIYIYKHELFNFWL